MKFILEIGFILFFTFTLSSQTTVSIISSPITCEDAELRNDNPTLNNGTSQNFISNYWTANGVAFIQRSVMKFDFNKIPLKAKIINVKLSLYCNIKSGHAQLNSNQGGSNSCKLSRIISPWSEKSINWNNQPNITNINQVILPESTSKTQNYLNIDVTELFKEMIINPTTNYGFMISLVNEELYRAMVFASSDNDDQSLRPKVEITYSLPENVVCQTFNKENSNVEDAEIRDDNKNANYGTSPNFIANAWTASGNSFLIRSFIKFDISSLPSNAKVQSADLDLFCNTTSGHSQLHSSQSGANKSILSKVLSNWYESNITWGNQPITSQTDYVVLEKSSSETQNYFNIDITELVKDMHQNPNNNFGLMLSLEEEIIRRSIVFASSDHSYPQFHPELNVCYVLSTDTKDIANSLEDIKLLPNPAINYLDVIMPQELRNESVSIEILDMAGKVINKYFEIGNVKINTSKFEPGQYLIKFFNNNFSVTKKFIKI